MAQRKPTILWLEDVPKTAAEVVYFVEKEREFVVEQVAQLHEFAEILNDPAYKVKGIVLDVMLYGVDDLDALDIDKKVDTDMGAEAGWRVLEHYLRAPDSKFKDIPVLVLSMLSQKPKEKNLVEKLNKVEGAAPITFIEKRGRKKKDENGKVIHWTQQFLDWFHNDVKKRNSL